MSAFPPIPISILVDTESFKQIEKPNFVLGLTNRTTRQGNFVNLTRQNDGNYVLSISKIEEQAFTELTHKLNTLFMHNICYVMGEKNKDGVCKRKEYVSKAEGDSKDIENQKQKDIENTIKVLTKINDNVESNRSKWCRWCLIIRTGLNLIPVQVSAILPIDRPVSISPKATYFPLLSRTLAAVDSCYVRLESGAHQFSSGKSRFLCLIKSIANLFYVVISPFVALYNAIARPEKYDSTCHQVNDAIGTIVLSPVIHALAAVKYLFAAIFHPGIAVRPV